MATHKRKKFAGETEGNNPNRKFEFKGFVNYDLSDAEKERLSELDLEVEFPLASQISDAVGDRYKVTLSYDVGHSCYTASLTDVNGFRDAFGYILTGRGKSMHHAWAALMYRHLYVFPDGWEVKPPEKAPSDFA